MQLNKFKKLGNHVMKGISLIVPLLIINGLFSSLYERLKFKSIELHSFVDVLSYIESISMAAQKLLIPVLSAGIAHSISSKDGIVPGAIMGSFIDYLNVGFLGGVISGILSGCISLALNEITLSQHLETIGKLLFNPILTILLTTSLFLLFFWKPITLFNVFLTETMEKLQGKSRFVLGFVVGMGIAIDMGGPINKTVSSFVNGLGVEGIYGPMAAKILGGMIAPIGLGVSCFLVPHKFQKSDLESAKSSILMGFFYITEGGIPFLIQNPVEVMISTSLGSGIASGLSMVLGIESVASHGGIFVIPQMNKPFHFVGLLLLGVFITSITYAILKKK